MLAADTRMHLEYLPIMANSVPKNLAAKDLVTHMTSGWGTDERFAHKKSSANIPDHFAAATKSTRPYSGKI